MGGAMISSASAGGSSDRLAHRNLGEHAGLALTPIVRPTLIKPSHACSGKPRTTTQAGST
jgi:hypothetical protein